MLKYIIKTISSVILKFCARVDTHCKETLIDYATELNIAFLIGSKFFIYSNIKRKSTSYLSGILST